MIGHRLNTYQQPSDLVAMLRDRAAAQPDVPAFSFLGDGKNEESSLTYAELDGRARAIGASGTLSLTILYSFSRDG